MMGIPGLVVTLLCAHLVTAQFPTEHVQSTTENSLPTQSSSPSGNLVPTTSSFVNSGPTFGQSTQNTTSLDTVKQNDDSSSFNINRQNDESHFSINTDDFGKPSQTISSPTETNSPSTQSDPFESLNANSPSSTTEALPTRSDFAPFSGSSVTDLSGATNAPSTQRSSPLSVMLLKLAVMLAGRYSNIDQYLDDMAKNVTGPNMHSFINVNYVPVHVPVLGEVVTFYYEQHMNNETKPARQALYAFRQKTPCTIQMSTYDIAKPNEVSITPEGLQALKKLQPHDLSNRAECDASWVQREDDFFTSFLSSDQCTFDVAGGVRVRPSGSRNLTCTGMTFTEVWRRVDGNQIVGGTTVPYVCKKIDNPYPVPVSVFSTEFCFKAPCSGNDPMRRKTWEDIKPHMGYNKEDNSTQGFGF